MSFPSQNTPKANSAGASPHILLGELTVLPQTPSWFQGGRFAAGGNRGEGRTRGGEEGKVGKGGMEKGGGMGEVGGIAPWLFGDKRHCAPSFGRPSCITTVVTTIAIGVAGATRVTSA